MKRLAYSIALLIAILRPAPTGAAGAWREMPWREAGLTERQAAGHLLNRLAYGARPEQIEELLELGLRNWVEGQLAGYVPGSLVRAKLARMPTLALSQREIMGRYSQRALISKAMARGVISPDDYYGRMGEDRLQRAIAALERYSEEQSMLPAKAYLEELRAQKLLRAVDSSSQLVEVLTDFWFNHFNVSTTKPECRVHILSYERDAIRPNVLLSFRELLGATARHPAMLLYLDNASSRAPETTVTSFEREMKDIDRLSPGDNPSDRTALASQLGWRDRSDPRRRRRAGPRGLNENYARELLELHTLGVDGGYSQSDVIEVARAFTGWASFPPGGARQTLLDALTDSEIALEMGFVIQDEFVFRPDYHDSEAKSVLGVALPAGRGFEDGEEVLDLLAAHPSTVRHVTQKLAARFVSENPPAALIDRMVETWELSDGDLRELLRTLVESPEFWSAEARESKVKTPFELAASSLRALGADVTDTTAVVEKIRGMGQPLYAFSAPTGYPETSANWTGVGAMLARINFGLELGRGSLEGVTIDLPPLIGSQTLNTLEEAVEVYFEVLMPERDSASTLLALRDKFDEEGSESRESAPSKTRAKGPRSTEDPTSRLAAHAVGMLIASPEFQVH